MYDHVLLPKDTDPAQEETGTAQRAESCAEASVLTGRIDRKIEFPLPDEKTKKRIFQIHTSRMTLADDVTLDDLIMAKDDLSGADIKVRTMRAGTLGFVTSVYELEWFFPGDQDLEQGLAVLTMLHPAFYGRSGFCHIEGRGGMKTWSFHAAACAVSIDYISVSVGKQNLFLKQKFGFAPTFFTWK